MESLKKCPFCGGEAENDFGFTHDNKTYFYVNCLQCGTETNHFETKAKASTAWETRADDWDELIEQRDELLKACKKAVENMEQDAVQANGEWQTGMFCGLEDRNITDRYDACMYGYNNALKKVQEWVIGAIEEGISEQS